jgi:RimJ/RimL family protein N-acetyltransferase
MATPTLTDGVVTIDAHRLEDAPEVLRGRQLPEVERAWLGRKMINLFDAQRQIEYAQERWAVQENFFWAFAIRQAEAGTFMGTLIAHHSIRGPGSMLDIWLLPEHRGGGNARRAVLLGLEYVFDHRGMPWVELEILPDNDAASRLASELGFVVLPDELRGFPDRNSITIPYRMTREAWDGRPAEE